MLLSQEEGREGVPVPGVEEVKAVVESIQGWDCECYQQGRGQGGDGTSRNGLALSEAGPPVSPAA